jgi:hypothetical protein
VDKLPLKKDLNFDFVLLFIIDWFEYYILDFISS